MARQLLTSCAVLAAASASSTAYSIDSQSAAALLGRQGASDKLPAIISDRQEQRSVVPQAAPAKPSSPNAKVRAGKDTFESYVEKVTNANLDIFGKDLFQNVPNTFAPLDATQVNPDYVIGSGDELQIRGWGMVDIDVSTAVDRSGTVHIPRIGSVKVAGIKYRDLQDYLKKAVGKFYTNFDLTVSVAQTRAVQIYVVGHAVRPGTYTLSAMSTVLNALFASGGPNATGTMRNIQVKRDNATVTTFDFYDMLVKGDKSRDIGLQDGDVIFIPEVGPLVALTGNVKKPAVFELKGAASVADAVTWAGGFDSAAEGKDVIIEKNVDNNYQTVAQLTADSLSASGPLGAIPLRPTDILRVFSSAAVPVQVQVQNEHVRVSGEVSRSGVFQIKKGETLRQLLSRLGGPTDNGYLFALKLNRETLRRAQQEKLDEIADRFERELESTASERIAGTSDKELIAVVDAEVNRQRRIAQNLRAIKAEGRVVLELPGGDAELKHLPDFALQDGDTIHIPRKPGTVNVFGAVFQQNAFMHRPRRSVRDYLDLAGGPTINADTSEIYLIRADGTTQSGRSTGWFSGLGSLPVHAGDTVVVPQTIERNSLTQSLKEWTSILYQFGLGAAGLKVLQN